MDDLIGAMFALALSAVMLVTGQQYLSKKLEISAPSPQIAVISLPGNVR
jgi:hypothetical protein